MSQVVIVDPRLPGANDKSIVNTLKSLTETNAQAQEDAKNDPKRKEKFTDQPSEKSSEKNNTNQKKVYIHIVLLFVLVVVLGIIVRKFKLPKMIKFGLAGLFVFILIKQIGKLH
jgi:hypothetical protein